MCRLSIKRYTCSCYQSILLVVYWLYLESCTSEKFTSCSTSSSDWWSSTSLGIYAVLHISFSFFFPIAFPFSLCLCFSQKLSFQRVRRGTCAKLSVNTKAFRNKLFTFELRIVILSLSFFLSSPLPPFSLERKRIVMTRTAVAREKKSLTIKAALDKYTVGNTQQSLVGDFTVRCKHKVWSQALWY